MTLRLVRGTNPAHAATYMGARLVYGLVLVGLCRGRAARRRETVKILLSVQKGCEHRFFAIIFAELDATS